MMPTLQTRHEVGGNIVRKETRAKAPLVQHSDPVLRFHLADARGLAPITALSSPMQRQQAVIRLQQLQGNAFVQSAMRRAVGSFPRDVGRLAAAGSRHTAIVDRKRLEGVSRQAATPADSPKASKPE